MVFFLVVITDILIETFQHWKNARQRCFFSRIESKLGEINGCLKNAQGEARCF